MTDAEKFCKKVKKILKDYGFIIDHCYLYQWSVNTQYGEFRIYIWRPERIKKTFAIYSRFDNRGKTLPEELNFPPFSGKRKFSSKDMNKSIKEFSSFLESISTKRKIIMKKELNIKITEVELIIRKLSFTLYGDGYSSIVVSELMKIDGECIAKLEDSGSEGHYCEIARWNPKTQKYYRYAFAKFLGGEILDWDGKTCATNTTEYLNKVWHIDEEISLIHHLDDWSKPIVKEDDTDYSIEDWKLEVNHDKTSLGYKEWVEMNHINHLREKIEKTSDSLSIEK